MKFAVEYTEGGIKIFNTRSLKYEFINSTDKVEYNQNYDIYKKIKSHHTRNILMNGKNSVDDTISYFKDWLDTYLPRKSKIIPTVWELYKRDIVCFKDAILFNIHNTLSRDMYLILVSEAGLFYNKVKGYNWMSYSNADDTFDRIEYSFGDLYCASSNLKFSKVKDKDRIYEFFSKSKSLYERW